MPRPQTRGRGMSAPMTFSARTSVRRHAALALAATLGLAACARIDPGPSLTCPAFATSGAAPVVMSSQDPGDAAPMASGPPPDAEAMTREVRRATIDRVEDAILAEARTTPRGQPVVFRVLALSAGGQYGAFGAGFLTGWGRSRGPFDLVTGVSAGSILAPVAFAGPDFDGSLKLFDGLDRDDVFETNVLGALTGAPALASSSPLRRALEAALTDPLIAAVAARAADDNRLLVGVTDMETTALEVFDLGAAAGGRDARDCIVAALLASSAIPGLLPPQRINGRLYADGGLRSHVFFEAIDAGRRAAAARTGRRVLVDAHLIINGSLHQPTSGTDGLTLPGYIDRAVSTLADEVLRDSLSEAVAFAEGRTGWTLRGLRAEPDLGLCREEDQLGGFNSCVTRALFEHGREVGSLRPIPWLDAGELRALADAL